MSKKVLFGLWLFTGSVALVLLATTIGLAVQARSQSSHGDTVYLTGQGKLVVLLNQPTRSGIVASIVERGTVVTLVDLAVENDQTWYQVRTDSGLGWVQADHISLTPP